MKKTTIKTLLLGLSLMAGTAWAQQAQVAYWEGTASSNGNNPIQDATFGTIAVTDAGGGNVTLTAVPYPGIKFDGWYDGPNGTKKSGNNPYTVADSETTYYAKFAKNQFNFANNTAEWGTYSCNVKTTSVSSNNVTPYIVKAIHPDYVEIEEISLVGGSSCKYYVASNEGVLLKKKSTSTNSGVDYSNPMGNRKPLAYYGNILVGTGSNTFTVPNDGKKYFAINAAGDAFELLAVGATIPTNKAYLVDDANITTTNTLAIGAAPAPGPDPTSLLVKVAYWQGNGTDQAQNEAFGEISATLNGNGKVTLTGKRVKLNNKEVTRFHGWYDGPNGTLIPGTNNKTDDVYTYEVDNEDVTYYAMFRRTNFGGSDYTKTPTTNPEGYASYSAPVRTSSWGDNFVSVYIVEESGIANGEVTLTMISNNNNYVEAGEGVICGKSKTTTNYTRPYPSYEKGNKTSFMNNGNILIGTSDKKFTVPNDDYNYYALAIINDVLGFYIIDPGVVIPELKAYLKLPKSSAGSRTALFIADQDGTTTAIKDIENDAKSKVFYNTAGQKVSPYYRGIVIKNGKKCFTK